MKLWTGGIIKAMDPLMEDFNQSESVDKRLYKQDIQGSLAHVAMLGRQGILPQVEATLIQDTLHEIREEIEAHQMRAISENGCFIAQDTHTTLEMMLIDRIGEVGKKVNTGRSRSDQLPLQQATSLKLYLKEEIHVIQAELHALQSALLLLAKTHAETVMPGYAHLQRTRPVTLAHHLMAYFEMFRRDRQRLQEAYNRADVLPFGSPSLAGMVHRLDRYAVARQLGFEDITASPLDGVSDRDHGIELVSNLSILMMHTSRLCEELVLWSSREFDFIALEEGQKNPVAAELIRGKTGRVYGNLMALLTVMKGLPVTYSQDLQEAREPLFDAADTVKQCLPVLTSLLKTLTIKPEVMAHAAQGGFLHTTDVADYLLDFKNLPEAEVHAIMGRLVMFCLKGDRELNTLSLAEFQQISPRFEADLTDALAMAESVRKHSLVSGPAREQMEEIFSQSEIYLKYHSDYFLPR